MVGLGLTHLSCYQLTLEPGTRLFDRVERGELQRPDDGAVADTFLAIHATLHRLGLSHYEISNYARPGDEARHNLGYWHGEEYLGLGCAAFGFRRSQHTAVRYRNDIDPLAYLAATRSPGGVQAHEAQEPLDGETLMRERIMLGLRLAEGVDLAQAAAEVGTPGWTLARQHEAGRLEAQGRLVREQDRVRIPPDAWLWTDDTAARLF
jgi:oxygen-independent coproporphyrinogen-3 oxidase